VLASIIAIKMVGSTLHVSIPKSSNQDTLSYLESIKNILLDEKDIFSRDDEYELLESISKVQRARYLNEENITKNIYEKISQNALYIARENFVSHGRIELIQYYIEKSI